MASGKLFVFSAPSGAGKSTIIERLKTDHPEFTYSISVTTRQPRAGEKEGVHYYFKTEAEFQRMIQNNEFLEYMQVHNNYYGTLLAPIRQNLQMGSSMLLDLDVYGKVNFDKVFPTAIGILILPPSIAELKKRLKFRKTDSDEVIELRIQNATKEMEFAESNGKYEYRIINDKLNRAYAELKEIVEKELAQ